VRLVHTTRLRNITTISRTRRGVATTWLRMGESLVWWSGNRCTHHSTAAHPFARWSYICPPTIAPTAEDTAEVEISFRCETTKMCSTLQLTERNVHRCKLMDFAHPLLHPISLVRVRTRFQLQPTVTLAAMVISNPTGAIAQLKNKSAHHIISRHKSPKPSKHRDIDTWGCTHWRGRRR
jgi:hypothetical protein